MEPLHIKICGCLGANYVTADDKGQKFMVFEGLSDEDGASERDEPLVEPLEDNGISNR